MSAVAGDIVFNITGDDSGLRRSMAGTGNFLQQNFSAMTKMAAVAAAAIGASIFAMATKSINGFADLGDEIAKLQDRTGLTAETLSRLHHAADLSDTSIKRVGDATRRFSQLLQEARNGSDSAAKSMYEYGLYVQDFQGLNPDEIFLRVADHIAGIQDPTYRAAAAMNFWGKAGNDLLPMLANGSAGLRQMMADTKRLFTDEDTKRAAAYKDALTEVDHSTGALQDNVARALIPALTELANKTADVIDKVTAWTAENPELTASIVQFTTGIGGIAIALSPVLFLLPGIVTAVGLVGKAFVLLGGVVSAPVALVVAAGVALVGAGYYIWENWEWVKEKLAGIWNWIANTASSLWESTKAMMQDIGQWLGIIEGGVSVPVTANTQGTPGGISQQNAHAQSSTNGTGGRGALGFGGITINVNGAGDPGAVSRMVADALRGELRARGFAT